MVLFLSFFNVSRKILKCSFYLYINGTVYLTRAAPKVTPPILLYCPVSEADVGGMAVESESSISIPLHFVAVEQMAAEGQ